MKESVGHQGEALNKSPKIVQNLEDTKHTSKASLNVKVKQFIDHQTQACNINPKKVQNQGDFKHTSEASENTKKIDEASENTKKIDEASLLNEKVKQIMDYQIKAFNDNLKIVQNRGYIKHTTEASSIQTSEDIVPPQSNAFNKAPAEVTQEQNIDNKSEARAQTPLSTSTKKVITRNKAISISNSDSNLNISLVWYICIFDTFRVVDPIFSAISTLFSKDKLVGSINYIKIMCRRIPEDTHVIPRLEAMGQIIYFLLAICTNCEDFLHWFSL